MGKAPKAQPKAQPPAAPASQIVKAPLQAPKQPVAKDPHAWWHYAAAQPIRYQLPLPAQANKLDYMYETVKNAFQSQLSIDVTGYVHQMLTACDSLPTGTRASLMPETVINTTGSVSA